MAATKKENQNVALWKGLSMVSFVLFIATLLIVFLYKGRDIPVATVDGVKISQNQLYKALVDYEGPKILEKLILEDLIMKESKAAG